MDTTWGFIVGNYEQDALAELMFAMSSGRSKMQASLQRGMHGEFFLLRDLAVRGTQTPSQLAKTLGVTSGRVSAMLGVLEKKGLIVRTSDPNDGRSMLISITHQGFEHVHAHGEQMRKIVYWIFSQMGERRTKELVQLVGEFMTYMSICNPNQQFPTDEQIREAFDNRQEQCEQFKQRMCSRDCPIIRTDVGEEMNAPAYDKK